MSWGSVLFTDAVKDVTSGNAKIKSGDYLEQGVLPVIDQGKGYIGGYIDDEDLACKSELPVVIFGDHTREIKFVDQAFALGADGVKVLKPLSDSLDEKYLYYFLKQARLPEDAGYSRHFKFVKRLKIPLPPLKEQKRIAAILDKADAIRRKRQQAIDLTDQLLRSVFLEMFGDPVTNPKGFEIKNLKDIAHIQIGPFGTQLHKEDYIEGGVPLINPTHIVNGNVVPKSSLSISSDKHSSLSEYHLSQGDIIMGRRGEMGRCALITEKENGWMCGTGSLFIRPKITGVFSEYLYTLLSSAAIKKYLEGESLGATMPNLNKGIVGNVKIPVPKDEIINKYFHIRKKHDDFKNKLNAFSGKELFESLTQQAFNGQLSKQTQAA